jgi:pimeloyl-ACP methyl ester carboxylesterase
VFLTIVLTIPALFVLGYILDTDVPHWIVGLIFSAVVLVFWFGLFRMLGKLLVNRVTRSFVDVVRYLDTSPESYAARRAIRGGLVDLLQALHDGRYSRIVVVAHSLGAYIAYDAVMSLWADTHTLHAAPPSDPHTPLPVRLAALGAVEDAADRLTANGGTESGVDEFQDLQFALWQDLRWQGNPWRITDFITVGTPMALADILVTRPGMFSGFKKSDRTDRREVLDQLVRRGALVRCPPRSETLAVESTGPVPASFRWRRSGAREVLGSQSPFAVTRWTNIWFPVIRGQMRLVRRCTAPAVRPRHPRHRGAGKRAGKVPARVCAHRVLPTPREGA